MDFLSKFIVQFADMSPVAAQPMTCSHFLEDDHNS
jgi:hypothetical protein